MKITFASHTPQVGVFRVGSHHLSRELTRAGHEVVHISTPMTLAHIRRIKEPTVRARMRLAVASPVVDEHGVRHCEPIIPLPINRIPQALGRLELRWPLKPWRFALGAAARRGTEFLLIDQPLMSGLIDILDPAVVVYRPTDAHPDRAARSAEIAVLRRADAVVATSKSVLDTVTRDLTSPIKSLVIENGVEYERFTVTSGEGTARSGVVYVGAIDQRFDWNLVCLLAAAFPRVGFTLAGPLPAEVPVRPPPNVHLLGPVSYVQVPALLRSAQVGLLPLSSDPGNAGRSPMKYYEYLASGLSVVATKSDTLAMRRAPGVTLFEDFDGAITALGAALDAPENHAGVEFARGFSWCKQARALADFLERLR